MAKENARSRLHSFIFRFDFPRGKPDQGRGSRSWSCSLNSWETKRRFVFVVLCALLPLCLFPWPSKDGTCLNIGHPHRDKYHVETQPLYDDRPDRESLPAIINRAHHLHFLPACYQGCILVSSSCGVALTVFSRPFLFLQHEAPFYLALPKGDKRKCQPRNQEKQADEPGFLRLWLTSHLGHPAVWINGGFDGAGFALRCLPCLFFPERAFSRILYSYAPGTARPLLISIQAICRSLCPPCFLLFIFFLSTWDP